MKEGAMKALFAAAAVLAASSGAWSQTATFDADPTGKPPAGWICGVTGKGNPRWTVEADRSAPSPPNVLQQSGSATFAWCVKDEIARTDGTVEVHFKPVAGKEDQAGGVVWRWKDRDNYYVARANALEGNVVLYHTTKGVRHTIASRNAFVAPNAWHVLRVECRGEAMSVSLDGKITIQVQDSHLAGAGKAGVWTKADSVTLFDDFRYITSGK
jgi:hypothetical protein